MALLLLLYSELNGPDDLLFYVPWRELMEQPPGMISKIYPYRTQSVGGDSSEGISYGDFF